MKKFLTRSFIFSMPLIIWALIVLVIDPFNYFNISHIISDEIKKANAETINPLMYETIDCVNHPAENILVGDSRTRALPADEIKKLSGIQYKKLVASAAKLNEIFDLIYFSDAQRKLKHIVVGINFNMFNKYGYADRITAVKEIMANPFKYIFNRNIAQAGFYVVKAAVTGKNIDTHPPLNPEKFWKYMIKKRATEWYSKYKFPEQTYARLKSLDSFAVANHIELTFIIVPHNREFHDRLVSFGLENEEARFKEIMSSLSARVIDYDFENAITADRNNFDDPVHYNKKTGLLMVNEIWSDSFAVGKVLK